jgi:hypothetical protein
LPSSSRTPTVVCIAFATLMSLHRFCTQHHTRGVVGGLQRRLSGKGCSAIKYLSSQVSDLVVLQTLLHKRVCKESLATHLNCGMSQAPRATT